MSGRLFIVSNRLPVTIENGLARRSSGGLISAIDAYMHSNGKREFSKCYWVGTPGCSEKVWNELEATEDEYDFMPVFLPNKIYDQYYNGFSNSVLWPLFHYFPSYAEYNSRFWYNYLLANEAFAEVIAQYIHEEDVIWIHDYHLMPLAAMIREKIPGITIAFFLHIPFPSYELFRMQPQEWQYKLMEGLLGADLIGFHTIDYTLHFLECARILLKLEHDRHFINYENRKIKADIFPISIDFNLFNQNYNKPEVEVIRADIKKILGGRKLIFSVDRLDYTKGVPNRLKAYELFLRRHPEHHGNVVFNMVVVPSRDTIARYADRKRSIDEFIGNINSKYGNINWQPVIYQYRHMDFDELCALYGGSDIALITPLRDGMNLVAKEFVASRFDKSGVLILSDMAGAAKELSDALIINPNDIEQVSRKIEEALVMPLEEQKIRIDHMQRHIRRYDINTWAGELFKELYNVKRMQLEQETKFVNNAIKIKMFLHYSRAKKRLLMLDYDGSLMPFAKTPDKAEPTGYLLSLLKKLAEDNRNHVVIISGRDGATLEKWFEGVNVNIIAEHGASYKQPGQEWSHQLQFIPGWKEDVEPIMEHYIARAPKSFVEQKKYSLAWHYRQSEPLQGRLRARELMKELDNVANNYDLEVLDGNKVVEVRNMGINKGTATARMMKCDDYDFVLAIGDDKTDEDMFRELANETNSYTIKIGQEASFAKYNLHDPATVHALLENLIDLN